MSVQVNDKINQIAHLGAFDLFSTFLKKFSTSCFDLIFDQKSIKKSLEKFKLYFEYQAFVNYLS